MGRACGPGGERAGDRPDPGYSAGSSAWVEPGGDHAYLAIQDAAGRPTDWLALYGTNCAVSDASQQEAIKLSSVQFMR
jgi:hypothetical protein